MIANLQPRARAPAGTDHICASLTIPSRSFSQASRNRSVAVRVDVIAVEQTFTALRHSRVKPELTVDQRQIPKVFAISESLVLLLIVGFGVFIPENVERVKERLGTPEQEITELRLAIWIETYDLAIEGTAATFQVASQGPRRVRGSS